MSINATRDDLRRWGKDGQAGVGLGLPTIVSFMKIRLGRSSATPPESDPVVAQIEKIVTRAPVDFGRVLINHYAKRMNIYRLSREHRCRKDAARKLLDNAEWYVHTELEKVLDGADCLGVYRQFHNSV